MPHIDHIQMLRNVQEWTSSRDLALKSGMRHDWSFFQGCMIEPKPGQWVPMKNYRVL